MYLPQSLRPFRIFRIVTKQRFDSIPSHPHTTDVEEGSNIAVTCMEEFSDYLLHQEEVQEKEDGSMLEI